MFILFSISSLLAQSDSANPRMLLGLYGGYGLNSLSGTLSSGELPGTIPGSGECGSFQEGSGAGILGGLLFEYRLSSLFSGGARLEYADRSGEMTYRCIDPAQARLPDGSLATAETDHIAEISLGSVALHLLVAARPFKVPLVFSAGPSISFGLGGDYKLTERIVTPRTAEFVTGGQVREYGNGSLAGDGGFTNVGLTGALGYELRAGESWRLRPEVSLSIPLGDDLPIGRVRSTGLRFTLGIMRVFEPEPVEVVTQTPPVAINEVPAPPQREPLQAALQVDNGSGWTEGPLVIRRFVPIHTRLIPLLPYVFFDNRRDDLPLRYVRMDENTTARFSETNLVSSTNLDVYSHVLNIVGSRLRRYPDANLTLTGTAPDAAEGSPSASLAQLRAESVRTYLNRVWGISNERINIVPRRDPEVPTNPETPEGRAENRRVELSSNRIEILAPLAFTDTLGSTEHARARLLLKGPAGGITEWRITSGNDKAEAVSTGNGPVVLDDELTLPALETFRDNDILVVDVNVVHVDSTTEEHTLSIPVKRDDTYATRIASGEYSLILFDAANADLRDEHRRVIDAIATLLPEEATVSIYGYTDYLGDSTENQGLSERRAEQVAERFRASGANIEIVTGLGEDTETFNVLGFPEERMYARRVVIEVKRK